MLLLVIEATVALAGARRWAAMSTDSAVLAPLEVSRRAVHTQHLSANSWLIPSGEPVAAFVGANGPPHITRYNWNRLVQCRSILSTSWNEASSA